MLKYVITAILIYATFMLFKNTKRLAGKKETKSDSTPVELVKDPICETFVQKDTPYKVKYYDNFYFFCSEECREKFIEKNKKES